MLTNDRPMPPDRLAISMPEGEVCAEIRDIAAWATVHETSFAALICEWATRGGIHALARHIRHLAAAETEGAETAEDLAVPATDPASARPELDSPFTPSLPRQLGAMRERTTTMQLDTAFFQQRWNRLMVLQQELKRQMSWTPTSSALQQQRLQLVQRALYSTWADLETCRETLAARTQLR